MRFFSIVTICRNNLPELETTYNSIKDQSFNDFEWIVVDGNSTDGTRQWLQKNRLAKWKSESDQGIFDAMNKGIRRSEGRYLIFMNSGDAFASDDVLEKSFEGITENNYPAFVYGDSVDIDETGRQFYRKAKKHQRNKVGMITQHQSMFFARNAIGNNLYPTGFPITGDYAFISEILGKLDEGDILQLDFAISHFSMGGVNEVHRFKALKEDFRIRKEIMKLPFLYNCLLYTLHYMHTVLKKKNPAVRFMLHKKLLKQ
jgi:putative colanic acid biosynthesis glycosyltransferase